MHGSNMKFEADGLIMICASPVAEVRSSSLVLQTFYPNS